MSAVPNEYVWVITGANRGIGLELTKQVLQSPANTVIATVRNPAKADALQALRHAASSRLHIVSLDVTDRVSISACAHEVASIVGERGVDYLINNAGICPSTKTAFEMDTDEMQQAFLSNVVGPAFIAQSFLGIVEKSKKKTIVNISSTMGSIGSDMTPLSSAYSISKSALNMLTYKEAKEKPELTIISMCPGWLQTDMGGENATTPVSVGVEGIVKVVTGLKHEDTGSFFNYTGARVPW